MESLSFALKKMLVLVKEEAEYLRSLKDDIRSLKNDVERMGCFLSDTVLKELKYKGTQKWVSEIREVALDAEDIVESYIIAATNRRHEGGLKRLVTKVIQLNTVGKQIQKIRKRLEEIESSRVRYNVSFGDDITWERRVEKDTELGRRANLQDESIIGLDKEIHNLSVKVILNESKALSIISIVGMGGIGKSTLARKLYQEVAPNFDCSA